MDAVSSMLYPNTPEMKVSGYPINMEGMSTSKP